MNKFSVVDAGTKPRQITLPLSCLHNLMLRASSGGVRCSSPKDKDVRANYASLKHSLFVGDRHHNRHPGVLWRIKTPNFNPAIRVVASGTTVASPAQHKI